MIVRRILVIVTCWNLVARHCWVIMSYSSFIVIDRNVFVWYFAVVIGTRNSIILVACWVVILPTAGNRGINMAIGFTGNCTIRNFRTARICSRRSVRILVVNRLGFILSFITNLLVNVIAWICGHIWNFSNVISIAIVLSCDGIGVNCVRMNQTCAGHKS